MSTQLYKDFSAPQESTTNQSMTEVLSSRAEHEVQAAFVIAKKFPRNQGQSFVDIINACRRPALCEVALYTYPRGGTQVTGPSIRLAEMMAQNYGNIDCGIREISQQNGTAVAEAYAIDLQTNTRVTKVFSVKLERHAKKGITKLTDPRDCYEMIANQGSRRLRSCILAIIPGDIIEAAVSQVHKTLLSSDIPVVDQVKIMLLAFDALGVKAEHIEKRLGHNLDAIIPTELVTLKGILTSIKNGMAKREDFFDIKTEWKINEDSESLKALIDKNKAIVTEPTGEIIQENIQVETANIDQLTMIRDIIKESKVSNQKRDDVLKKFNVTHVEKLAADKVDEFIAQLLA